MSRLGSHASATPPPQGRPHWAKPHELTAGQLRGLYPKFDDFLRLRDALDPDRLFTNEMLDRMLGK